MQNDEKTPQPTALELTKRVLDANTECLNTCHEIAGKYGLSPVDVDIALTYLYASRVALERFKRVVEADESPKLDGRRP